MALDVAAVITYARQLAQTDSNGISDPLGIALTNDALQNFIRALLERDIDAAQTQESYTNLTTNSPNTYAWPADMYMLKTIEVNFQDQTQQNYLQASSMDVANIQDKSFDWLRVNQSNTAPLFDNRGDTFEIFPTPTVSNTGGVRIFYYLTPTEFTTTADTLSYPVTLDYRCLSARVASLYALTLGQTGVRNRYAVSQTSALESEYQKRLDGIIKILAPGTQQPITPEPLHISGWSF